MELSALAIPGGVLAIDAGNSKTDVALVAADGSVLGTARGSGFEPHRVGAAEAVAALAPLVSAVAGGRLRSGAPLVEHVSACLANADLPVEELRLQEAIDERGWGRSTAVANDTFALLRAGVDEPRGVAVVCGAGINCAGLLPDGRTARFASVGRISGDWGGGMFLSEEALWHAARAADGRGPETALAKALPAHYSVASMDDLIEALHLGTLPRTRQHEVIPVLFEVAESGDAVARSLVNRQAEEIVLLAQVALQRLDLLDVPAPVVLGGGLLSARQPLLLDAVLARLAAAAPYAEPHLVTTPPVVGAALLGLDRTGARADAQKRLRAAFDTRPPAAVAP